MAVQSTTPVYNALVASARVLARERIDAPQDAAWQTQAWQFYDYSALFRFGVRWLANALSKARLVAAKRPVAGAEPEILDMGPAADAIEALAGGVGGQSQLLHSFAVHLSVPGVGYLVGMTQDASLDWRVYASDEIRLKGKFFEVQVDANKWLVLPDESLVIKVWRPHERKHWEPDSPARALLATLTELKHVDEHISATLVSRLAGAGLLFLPQGMTMPTSAQNSDAEDPFQGALMAQMTTPIKDRGVAAAYVPLHVLVPDETIGKVQHMTFNTELDDRIIGLRESGTGVLATGMDLPAEIMTGLGGMNHWGAWLADETGVKNYVSPTLEIIVHALTIGYLQPTLTAQGQWSGEEIVWFDLSELALRPDRSQNALEAYDRLEGNGVTLRRELGIPETDKPVGPELTDMVWKRMLKDPALAPLALVELGIGSADLMPTGGPGLAPEAPVTETPANGPPAAGPVQPPPNAALMAASYSIVHRALERAGNRLRSKLQSSAGAQSDCPPEALHTCVDVRASGFTTDDLLDGAWVHVPELAVRVGVDPPWLITRLHGYTRHLLTAAVGLDWDDLEHWLDASPERAR